MAFEFSGTPTGFRRFWLVNNDGKVDMCLKDLGFETDLHVRSDIRCFVEAWRGFPDLRQEISNGKIWLAGPQRLISSFRDWLLLSALAPYRRRINGRKSKLRAAA